MLMNEDNYCSNWFFHTREQILCKNHTQNVSEFLSEKKLVYVWLLLLRLYEFMFVWECGNSRRNSLFVVLLLLFFLFVAVVWLPGCALTLIFCVSALAATHKRAHIHIHCLKRTCVLSTVLQRQGKAKKSMLCIHTQNSATHVFRFNRVAPHIKFCSFYCRRPAVNGKKWVAVYHLRTLRLNFFNLFILLNWN